jgi:phosphatidylglycerol:prolipoprotein diacylglycerol transferase
MHPELTLSLAGHEVVLPAIGLLYVVAWVVGLILATIVAWRRGLSWFWAMFVYACAIVGGIVGARLLDIADNWGYYAVHPGSMKALEFDHLALYGGLILAAIVGGWMARSFRLRVWRMADSAVPALALGIAIMRVGCFLQGCCFGRATDLAWGVTYPEWGEAWRKVLEYQVLSGETGLGDALHGPLPVHPTQIYEAIAALVVGLIAVWLLLRHRRSKDKPRTPEGVPFLTFILLFTLFRLFNHYLRAQTGTFTLPEWFYPFLYCVIFVLTLLLIFWRFHPGKAPRLPRLPGVSRLWRRAR